MRSVVDIVPAWCAVQVVCLVAVSCLTAGCHDLPDGVTALPADGEELPILRRYAGGHSHETRAMQLVIRDAATYARIPLQDVSVDFRKEMLLIVTLGRVTSDRYAVRIDRVWRRGHRLHVEVAVSAPPEGAPLTMASPYGIAIIPRCDLNVADFASEPPLRERSWHQSPLPSGR